MQTNFTDEMTKDYIALLAEVENMVKGKEGYGYKYTPLDEVLNYTRPLLEKHNFGLSQPITTIGDMPAVCTFLLHKSGGYLYSSMVLSQTEIKGANDAQQMGASITYARRYMLTSLLGIAGEEDTDGVAPKQRDQRRRESQPSQVESLDERLASASKMTYALLDKGKFTEDEKATWFAELEAIESMPNSDEKLTAWRTSYSYIQEAIKNA